MNRRQFIATLGAGIVGFALPPVPSTTLGRLTPIADARALGLVVIPQRKLMARILITREVLEASVHRPPGSFMEYCRRESAIAVQEAMDHFNRISDALPV